MAEFRLAKERESSQATVSCQKGRRGTWHRGASEAGDTGALCSYLLNSASALVITGPFKRERDRQQIKM